MKVQGDQKCKNVRIWPNKMTLHTDKVFEKLKSKPKKCLFEKGLFFGVTLIQTAVSKTLRLFYKIIFCLQNIRTLKNQPLRITMSRDKWGNHNVPVVWGLRWHFEFCGLRPPPQKKNPYRGEEWGGGWGVENLQNICILYSYPSPPPPKKNPVFALVP